MSSYPGDERYAMEAETRRQEAAQVCHLSPDAARPALSEAQWAIERVEDMQSNAEIDAGVYGVKLLRGAGYPNEVMSRAQDALALRTLLAMLAAQPLPPAPKDYAGLIQRIRAWQDDDQQGYGGAIGLLCEAADALEALTAAPRERSPGSVDSG